MQQWMTKNLLFTFGTDVTSTQGQTIQVEYFKTPAHEIACSGRRPLDLFRKAAFSGRITIPLRRGAFPRLRSQAPKHSDRSRSPRGLGSFAACPGPIWRGLPYCATTHASLHWTWRQGVRWSENNSLAPQGPTQTWCLARSTGNEQTGPAKNKPDSMEIKLGHRGPCNHWSAGCLGFCRRSSHCPALASDTHLGD